MATHTQQHHEDRLLMQKAFGMLVARDDALDLRGSQLERATEH